MDKNTTSMHVYIKDLERLKIICYEIAVKVNKKLPESNAERLELILDEYRKKPLLD